MGAGVSGHVGMVLTGLTSVCRFNLETQMGRLLGQHEDTVSQVVFSQAAGEPARAYSSAVLC